MIRILINLNIIVPKFDFFNLNFVSHALFFVVKENSESIFLSEGSSVFYIRPNAVGSETITELPLPLNAAVITGISYDIKSKQLFVADMNSPAIYSVNMTSLRIR